MSTIPAAGLRLQFCTDPGEFLAVAGDYLAARPVVSTVVTTVAHRLLAQQADGIAQPGPNWWLVVWSESAVVGAGMRTAPFAPYPPFLLPMPDEAAGCGSGSPRPGSGCISPASARPRSGWPAWARCTRRPPQRGHGWASNAVAEISRRIQAEGGRVCLFTDQANPTSNKIYAALGYKPVADMANLVIAR